MRNKLAARMMQASQYIRLARSLGTVRVAGLRLILAGALETQLDMYLRASFLEGFVGAGQDTWSRSPESLFTTVRRAVAEGDSQNRVYGALSAAGLSDKEILQWVSNSNEGVYLSALRVVRKDWQDTTNLGLDAKAIAAAVIMGIDPWTAKVLKRGPIGYSLGVNSAKTNYTPQLGGFIKGVGNQINRTMIDIWRKAKTRKEDELYQFDAFTQQSQSGPSPEGGAQYLLDALQGEVDSDVHVSLTQAISKFPNLLDIIEDAVSARIVRDGGGTRNQRRVLLWETLVEDPTMLDVFVDGSGQFLFKVDAPALGRALASKEGVPYSKGIENYARNTSPDLFGFIRESISKDSDVQKELVRMLDIQDVYREDLRGKRLPSTESLNPSARKFQNVLYDPSKTVELSQEEKQELLQELGSSKPSMFDQWRAEDRERLIKSLQNELRYMSPERREDLIQRKLRDRGFRMAKSRTAKLMSRQEAILRKYLASAAQDGVRAATGWEELPYGVRSALKRVKDQETLLMDVDRWFMDNAPARGYRWASSSRLSVIRLASAFPAGSPERKTLLEMVKAR